VFRKFPQQPELFFATTAHLTVRGHEVLAAGLEDFLRSSGLLARTASASAR